MPLYIGPYNLTPGGTSSGAVTSGAVPPFALTSGAVQSGNIGDQAVLSGNIGSGQISSGMLASGLIAGLLSGSASLTSGQVSSGFIGNAAVLSGSVGSGQIASGHLASGLLANLTPGSGSVNSGQLASGAVGPAQIASGGLGSGSISSGSIGPVQIVSGGLGSGSISSGSIGNAQIVSGGLGSGAISSGSISNTQIVSGGLTSGAIASGSIGSLQIASGVITNSKIASGGLGSGAISSGAIGNLQIASGGLGSGKIASGTIGNFEIVSGGLTSGVASGSIGNFQIASGGLGSGSIGSGQISSGHLASGLIAALTSGGSALVSGQVTSGFLGDASVVSGSIASGQVSHFHIGNMEILSGNIGSGQVASGHLASGLLAGLLSGAATVLSSGQVSSGFIGNNTVVSGSVASGQLFDSHFASGAQIDGSREQFQYILALETISGGRAVYRTVLGVGISNPTEQVKSPAIGIVVDNVASGQIAKVITAGPFELSSGMFPYGPHFQRETIYVLNSGLLGNQVQTQFVDYTSGLTFQALGVFTNGSGGMVTPNFNQQNTLMANAIVSGTVVQNAGTSIFRYPDQGSIASEYQFTNVRAGETISGVRAVIIASGDFAQGQTVLIAKAGDPFKMPAMGILMGNYASGDIIGGTLSGALDAGIIVGGTAFLKASDTTLFSGKTGVPIFVGLSGELTPSAPTPSGALIQSIGLVANWGGQGSGSAVLSIGYRPVSGDITNLRIGSGAVNSGHLASGLLTPSAVSSGVLYTTFKTGQTISGGRCVTITGSGTIGIAMAAQNGSGLPVIGVVYDNVLSGQLANVLVVGIGGPVAAVENPGFSVGGESAQVFLGTSGLLRAGAPGDPNLVVPLGLFIGLSGEAIINCYPTYSGQIGKYNLHSDAVQGVRGISNIASGTIGSFDIGSGAILSGLVGSAAIVGYGKSGFSSNTNGRGIASGSIGGFDIADLAIASGQLEVNQVGRVHLASGTRAFGTQYTFTAGETISGVKAVALIANSPINAVIVRAERQSGLRLPAIGVTISGSLSGGSCIVVTDGIVTTGASGMIASGLGGRILYVGSGGLIMNSSGFMGGTSSGAPLISGSVSQIIGTYFVDSSGLTQGIYVKPSFNVTSGILTTAQGNF